MPVRLTVEITIITNSPPDGSCLPSPSDPVSTSSVTSHPALKSLLYFTNKGTVHSAWCLWSSSHQGHAELDLNQILWDTDQPTSSPLFKMKLIHSLSPPMQRKVAETSHRLLHTSGASNHLPTSTSSGSWDKHSHCPISPATLWMGTREKCEQIPEVLGDKVGPTSTDCHSHERRLWSRGARR